MSAQKEIDNVVSLQKDVVVFHEDSGIVDAAPVSHVQSDLLDEVGNYTDSTIVSYLERPKVLFTGTFLAGDVYGNIGGAPSPPLFLPTSIVLPNTLVANKLQGIQGMRYGMEFHIVVNATRFASGRYGMYFVYTGGTTEDRAADRKSVV